MEYRQLLLYFLGFLLVGCSSEIKESTKTKKEQNRPNILFVMTDDHSRHAISAYGSEIIETPNIDYLAENGVLFSNCA
ncbi:MAG: sulfatase, partial [Flavobacteriales bacterium]|nr:sulfatase [Flavobacteriales bacterium]